MNIRNAALGLAALLMLGLAAAPSAQADIAEPDIPELVDSASRPVCPPYNPEAWMNCEVTVTPYTKTVDAVNVDSTPPTTRVCPLGTICYYVPVIYPDGLVYHYTYYITLYDPYVSADPNVPAIFDDACEILGPTCVTVMNLLEAAETTA